MPRIELGVVCACLILWPSVAALAADGPEGVRPWIIAHRGASGERPEHTLPAYERAVDQGADFIEPDLTATKDGQLICRHEMELGRTTDAPVKFPERKRVLEKNGKREEGWYAYDFTLAEIKTLKVHQAVKGRDQSFNGKFEVPTFRELLELLRRKERETGRKIGVCPEVKSPARHAELGLDVDGPMLALLNEFGFRTADDLCFVQSFDDEHLRKLAGKTKLRLLQLTGKTELTPEMLRQIAGYAWGVGPSKDQVWPNFQQAGSKPSSLTADAHAAGLKVVVYTFRREGSEAPENADPGSDYRAWRDLGIDGLFTDYPADAVAALRGKR